MFEDGKVGVETILMHTSGQWLCGVLLLPMTKQDPQAAGSAITYARRYALQSIAGVPSEDDDGNKASQGQNYNKPKKTDYTKEIAAYQAIPQDKIQAYWAKLPSDVQKAIIDGAS